VKPPHAIVLSRGAASLASRPASALASSAGASEGESTLASGDGASEDASTLASGDGAAFESALCEQPARASVKTRVDQYDL
jgi:hypothetical protein